jgi:hypothetical protein
MVSASLSDALCAPSKVLQTLFDQYKVQGLPLEGISSFPELVHSHFASVLVGQALDQVIPLKLVYRTWWAR